MNEVAEIIRAEISVRGAITFARFMELALYCPDYGYYERENDNIGKNGDFYTSVSVGSLFGELLAEQFSVWLGKIDAPRIQLVEAGAHDGRLAADILNWLREQQPALFQRLHYVICETSARREEWQRRRLDAFAGKVIWRDAEVLTEPGSISGVIFSNELLDAMPVHRMAWSARERVWFEWGVTVEAGRFQWTRLRHSETLNGQSLGAGRIKSLPPDLLAALPDGFVLEISPATENWWHDAAWALQKGHLLVLDYGLQAEEFLVPQRAAGTLRAYRRHKLCDDILAHAGEQDLTAHVDFSLVQAAGEAAGLRTTSLGTQADFLAGIVRRAMGAPTAGRWTPQKNREFRTLIHPEHLGHAFKVLVQSRL